MGNIGYIYKITNKVNGKCYIGQTSDSIEHRWKEHIYDGEHRDETRRNYPLYRAFRKYGIGNFSVEEVERCDLENLDDREIYWISYFDSKKNGYNQVYGGSGGKRYDLDEQEVIKNYNEFKNIRTVSNKFNVDNGVIFRILRKHNIKVISNQEIMKDRNKTVYQYDKENNILNKFNSFEEAGDWLLEHQLSNAKNNVIASMCIRYTLLSGKTECKGYIWECIPKFTQEEIDDFLKRRKEYKKKSRNNYIKKEKQIKLKQTSKLPKLQKALKTEISFCPICGNQKASKSTLCKKCNEDFVHNKSEQQREEKYGITRDILKQQIREMPFLQISKKYGISDNAVRKWCKRYNLPYKASEIKRYTDEDWEEV